jgi:hypothetical protein
MSEYIITLEDESKARSLLTYLKSLDFVSIKQKSKIASPRKKTKSKDFSTFLKNLP